MALFSKNKKTTPKKAEGTALVASDAPVLMGALDTAGVLLRPHITEKATDGIVRGVYVFDVSMRATKISVRQAILATYKVAPRTVRIVVDKPKKVRNARTGRKGKTTGAKKAYVYLKKGETITVM